ncbi:OTU domain-containing protein 3 [Mactra antiquata]
MSARRINRAMRTAGAGGGSRVHYVRADIVSHNQKQNERMVREAYRREKKMSSYLSEDENYPSFKNQLAKLGLELRDIPGDGNCLFRALGDQLEGHVRNHFRHRQGVVKYMVDHKEDFEPFLSEDTTFDRYISTLQKMGTYAGNDAIVAFARLHQVNIIIHQLNSPFLLIQGPQHSIQTTRQLHIAYHNGDHYSSVRKAGDYTESQTNIRLKIDDEVAKSCSKDKEYTGSVGQDEGMAWAVRDTQHLAEEVMNATGCTDENLVLESLHDCDYAVDATIAYLLQTMETMNGFDSASDSNSLASQMTSTDSGIWSENGTTPTKVLGAESALQRAPEINGARSKTVVSGQKTADVKLNSKQTKKLKKMEKKKRAEEKHKMKILGVEPQINGLYDDEDAAVTVISKDLQMAKI